MNVIRASVSFYVVDDYNKRAITDAQISCNGSYSFCINKRNGYYEFINLEKGSYIFEVKRNKFVAAKYEVDLLDEQAVELVSCLKYALDNSILNDVDKIVFSIRRNKDFLRNCSVRLLLDEKIPELKLGSLVKYGSKTVNINLESGFNERLLYQNYVYDKNPDEVIMLSEYDYRKNLYLSKIPIEFEIPKGKYLRPSWDFVTDKFGRFVLPINLLFFKNDSFKLKLIILKEEYELKASIKNENYIYLDVK